MNKYVIYIPNELKKHNITELLQAVGTIYLENSPHSYYYELDFSHLNFIDPVGVTALSNLLEWFKKNQIEFAFTNLHFRHIYEKRKDPIRFLDDSGFFKRYCGKAVSEFASVRETTIELELVAFTNCYYWLEKKFIPWLSETINQPKEYLVDLQQCLLEIFHNINEHANEQIGCVFAQHFPAENEVKVAISDFGVGIPYTVRSVLSPFTSDCQCIERAVERGFTSKVDSNGGAGLEILLENMIDRNKGQVYIHSNYGILNCNNMHNISSYNTSGFYPGTLFELVFKTNNLVLNSGREGEELWGTYF